MVSSSGGVQRDYVGTLDCHALQRKSHLCIPRKGISQPPNFNTHVSVSELYIPRMGPPAAE
jgi:hypothetical protein